MRFACGASVSGKSSIAGQSAYKLLDSLLPHMVAVLHTLSSLGWFEMQCLLLQGVSGAGKTTLMDVLAGRKTGAGPSLGTRWALLWVCELDAQLHPHVGSWRRQAKQLQQWIWYQLV